MPNIFNLNLQSHNSATIVYRYENFVYYNICRNFVRTTGKRQCLKREKIEIIFEHILNNFFCI